MTISATDATPGAALIPAENAPAISARNVSKRYGQVTALEGLTLDIHAGEVFGLLGPNGSGKTTFMRLLAGYLLPSAGSLQVAGYDVIRDSLKVRRCIGYVPEAAPLYRQMRVGEFLAFMARLRGIPERDVKGAVEGMVDRLALSAVVKQAPAKHNAGPAPAGGLGALRNQLLDRIEALTTEEDLDARAMQAWPQANTFTAADGEKVRQAFAARLAHLQTPQENPLHDTERQRMG